MRPGWRVRAAGWMLVLVMSTPVSALAESPSDGAASAEARSGTSDSGEERRTPLPWLALRGESAEPLTIESEEVELTALDDGSRVLRFDRDVHARQGDLALHADELEAFYAPEESEPSRLTARGNVRIDQPGQRAYCDEAQYDRAAERLACRGNARLVQGCDVVRGESIEFDISADRARVLGGARVTIGPREGAADCPADEMPR